MERFEYVLCSWEAWSWGEIVVWLGTSAAIGWVLAMRSERR